LSCHFKQKNVTKGIKHFKKCYVGKLR